MRVTFLDYLILMFISLLDIHKRNYPSHGKRKNGNLKRKDKHVLTLSELSLILKHSGQHMALSRLVTLSISSLRNLDIEANEFMIELIDFMMQQFLRIVTLNMLFPQTSKLNILGILSNFNLLTRGLNSLTYPVYLKINLLFLLFLLILKIRSHLSFIKSIINLFVVLF